MTSTTMAHRWAPSDIWGLARNIVVVGISAMITGLLVGGVGSRLFIRVAAVTAVPSAQGRLTEAGFRVGEVTFGGSLGFILLIGIFTGVVGAVLLAIFQPWLAWAGRWRGVAFGVILFATGSATSDVLNPDNIDFRILDNGTVVIPLIFGLFVIFGITVSWIHGKLDQRMPSGASDISKGVYGMLAISGVSSGLSTFPFLVSTSVLCDCDPPLMAFVFILVTTIGTLLWWIASIRSAEALRRISVVAGNLGVTGTAVFGLYRAISDSIEVLRL